MDRVKDCTKKLLPVFGDYVWFFVKWTLIALILGGICGTVGTAFHMSVDLASRLRSAHGWILYLLPVGGVGITALYHLLKMPKDKGTNLILDAISAGEQIPIVMAPLIFLSTFVTHLCGGSAGREGAALQLGGSIGFNAGRLLHLNDKDLRMITLCGMSALFSALFGTPAAAAVFAIEVVSVGIMYHAALLSCVLSALAAYLVSAALGVSPTRFIVTLPALSPGVLGRVALLSVAAALVSIVFCQMLHGTAHLAQRLLPNPYLRAAAGGALIVLLTLLTGSSDYNGAGSSIIAAAVESGTARPEAFFLKMVFTSITIGCGFKGGEVVPTLFVGATLGAVLGPILRLPAGAAAALCMIGLFCGVVNCPIASILLGLEMFGGQGIALLALVCAVSYPLSGYYGLYSSQRIPYSKTHAEYIRRRAQ